MGKAPSYEKNMIGSYWTIFSENSEPSTMGASLCTPPEKHLGLVSPGETILSIRQ